MGFWPAVTVNTRMRCAQLSGMTGDFLSFRPADTDWTTYRLTPGCLCGGGILRHCREICCQYRSAIAFGKAGEVLGAEKERALQLLLKKYAAGYWEEGLAYIARSKDNTTVMGITVEHITGKESRQA